MITIAYCSKERHIINNRQVYYELIDGDVIILKGTGKQWVKVLVSKTASNKYKVMKNWKQISEGVYKVAVSSDITTFNKIDSDNQTVDEPVLDTDTSNWKNKNNEEKDNITNVMESYGVDNIVIIRLYNSKENKISEENAIRNELLNFEEKFKGDTSPNEVSSANIIASLKSNKIIFSETETDSVDPIFKLLKNEYKPYHYYQYDIRHFTRDFVLKNDYTVSGNTIIPYEYVKEIYDWLKSGISDTDSDTDNAAKEIIDAITNDQNSINTDQIKDKLKVYYNGLLNLMNLQILNTIQNITGEEDQNLKNTIKTAKDDLEDKYDDVNTNLQSDMISKMEEKITKMKTTHEGNNETINDYKKTIKDNEQSSTKYMSNNEKEETNNRYFTYMLYVSIVYLVVLVLSLIYFQMNQDVLKIFLIISIILYISQYLLSEYFGREYFTDDEESSLMKYRELIYKYVKSGTTIINSNFEELSGILADEGNKKKKQYKIEKVKSKYQSDKSRSTYNTMTHSTEYLKDISELLYVLIVLSLISLLLKEYINNVALIFAMMVPILLFVFLTYFLRMNRRTNSQYNQMYW
jgi:hypothetical protein